MTCYVMTWQAMTCHVMRMLSMLGMFSMLNQPLANLQHVGNGWHVEKNVGTVSEK